MNTLKDRLFFARTLRGMTQAQLAKRVGCSQGTIGNVESGLRGTLRQVVTVARVLNVSSDWLADGKGKPPKKSDLDQVANAPLIAADNAAPPSRDDWLDKQSREAVEILRKLGTEQRIAAVANLKTFVGYLSPPAYGQALSVAVKK